MAATRLIALHINKGKSVAQCLADRTDYSQNAEKANNGEFISSYECASKTADEEFLLSKRQYQHITGRQQKHDVIAYQIRQSFKPGEITPEEANQVGYELAMRFTKGKHAFIVATHIDRAHIHNHIIQSFKPGEITPEEANQVGYELAMRFTKGKHAFIVATHIDRAHIHNHIIHNSTSLDATRKWNNFFFSGLAVQRLSDIICLEHGLSVITPRPYKERSKRTLFPKKKSQRELLCDAIDNLISSKPKTFQELTEQLAQMGYEFKDGKYPAFANREKRVFFACVLWEKVTAMRSYRQY